MKYEDPMKKLTAADPETKSPDLLAENLERLKALFPELVTEGPDGAAVNVDVLKALVGDRTVTDADEKYGLSWHGKRRARQLALTPSTGTLRPCPDDSVDWETTQNLMIEGDNLEVLKLLQKSYAGKVKLIYIDPPYNTGEDFVYPDDFKDNIRNYLELTGQVEGGRKISSNTEAGGRFHTDWLNMLYPRLRLARALLRDDGLLAVSIDDSEVARLLVMLEEVFGEENLVNVVAMKSSETSGVKMSHVDKRLPKIKEYVILVAARRDALQLAPIEIPKDGEDSTKLDKYLGYYSKIISNPEASPETWRITTVEAEMQGHGLETNDETLRDYKIKNASRVVYRTNNKSLEGLSFSTPTAEVLSPTGLRYIWWEGKQMLFLSDYLTESLCDLWTDISTINLNKETCGVSGFGEGQKPLTLLERLMQMVGNADAPVVLDFFAGSGTTGHAVMAKNAVDDGNRRYILVQLPEPLKPENKDQKIAADFCDKLGKPRNIAELTKERLRRAAKKITDENPTFAGDLGFRVFKLDSSNIRAWEPDRDDLDRTLLDHQEHLRGDRSEEDILCELLLKVGLDLCVPIERRTIVDKAVHSIGGGVLLACLATQVTRDDVEPLAQGIVTWHKALAPAGDTTCVFRDGAFVDDVAKTNLAAILSQHGLTTVRSL